MTNSKIADSLRPLAVAIASLRSDPRNLKQHPPRQLAALRTSLERFGQLKPIVVRREDRTVAAGNGLLAAATALGWSEIAAVVEGLAEREARAYALTDNRSAELATWDQEGLAAALQDEDLGLDAALWNEDELDALLDEALGEDREDDAQEDDPADVVEAPERPDPVSRAGDLWRLGRHRLIVGDSTDRATVRRLLAGAKLDVVFTDPPFAIFGSSTGVDQSVADDGMVRPFFRALFRRISEALKKFGHAYVCCDWRSYPALREESRAMLEPKNLIVWHKGQTAHSFHYGNYHELVAFFVAVPRATSMLQTEKGHRRINDSNVWQAKVVPVRERHHFAAKPAENVKRALVNSSDEGALVGDFFAGSGTTLLVCEGIARSCYTVEKDPRMADVVLSRWEKLTGLEPTLLAIGDEAGPSTPFSLVERDRMTVGGKAAE